MFKQDGEGVLHCVFDYDYHGLAIILELLRDGKPGSDGTWKLCVRRGQWSQCNSSEDRSLLRLWVRLSAIIDHLSDLLGSHSEAIL